MANNDENILLLDFLLRRSLEVFRRPPGSDDDSWEDLVAVAVSAHPLALRRQPGHARHHAPGKKMYKVYTVQGCPFSISNPHLLLRRVDAEGLGEVLARGEVGLPRVLHVQGHGGGGGGGDFECFGDGTSNHLVVEDDVTN